MAMLEVVAELEVADPPPWLADFSEPPRLGSTAPFRSVSKSGRKDLIFTFTREFEVDSRENCLQVLEALLDGPDLAKEIAQQPNLASWLALTSRHRVTEPRKQLLDHLQRALREARSWRLILPLQFDGDFERTIQFGSRRRVGKGSETSLRSRGACAELRVFDREIGGVVELAKELYQPVGSAPAPVRRVGEPATWAYGLVALAAATVVLSLLPLTWASLGALALTSALIVGATVLTARGRGSHVGATAMRLLPMIALVGFALVYGAAQVAGSDAVVGPENAHLHDPLLLSLQALVTGGFLDLELTGWARTVGYLEMLLLWGFVAAAAVEVSRRLRQVDEALDELRRQDRNTGDE